MKKIYKVPVTWEMMGYLKVLADTQEEALELAEKEIVSGHLPQNGEYVEDSYSIDSDILNMLEDDPNAELAFIPAE